MGMAHLLNGPLKSNIRPKKQGAHGSFFVQLRLWTLHHPYCKGPVKLIKQVKIAHKFLQFVLDQFHVIILSLFM